jgi:hypothetical protein
MALIGGILAPWTKPAKPPTSALTNWPFWDDTKQEFTLGDFANFPTFLRDFIGARPLATGGGTV